MAGAVRIEMVPRADKALLWSALQDYLAELSRYDESMRAEAGVYTYRWFDHYWIDATRWPFWASVDGEHAGFALVRRDDDGIMEMSEFYIRTPFRRRGIGLSFARLVLKRFPGTWDISEFASNTDAIAFWRRVLDGYPYGEKPYTDPDSGASRIEQRVTIRGGDLR